MRLSRIVSGASLALAFAVAGCGDSTGSGTNSITMSNAEVLEMYAEINAALAGANFSASKTAGGVSLSRVFLPELDKAVSISATVQCTPSGSVGVSGSSDESTTGGSFDITETFTACKTTHFTLGGSLNYAGNVAATSSSFTFNLTIKGDVSVSASDGR